MHTTNPVQNVYVFHYILKILITLSTLRVLVFRDILLVSRFVVFKHVYQQNNNAGKTSNFATAI